VNQIHLELCASPEWAEYVQTELLPWALTGHDLGDDVLEIGPGPGLTTDILRERVARLTAVEVDPDLAAKLRDRMAGTNVEVIEADATASGLPGDRFSAATCFTMLHHIPSPELQDRLFAEVARVLRPGGVFVGTDAIDNPDTRALHVDDTFVPVDPDTLAARLDAAGLTDVVVDTEGIGVRFAATRPAGTPR
jgi:SAM-dependent methyltransferase